MKRLAIVFALALSVGACSLDQFAAVEQSALAVITKIKAQAPVFAAEIDAAVNQVCLAIPAVNATILGIKAAVPNPGPKTVAAVNTGTSAIVGAQAACDAYQSTPTVGKVALLMKLWAGYNAGKAAATAANAAAGA